MSAFSLTTILASPHRDALAASMTDFWRSSAEWVAESSAAPAGTPSANAGRAGDSRELVDPSGPALLERER